MEGIQNLGRGSKRDDPLLTGQYGIGFNAVYHLTDCPSFLSDNKILCVLDPHCRYVLGATREKPGRYFDTSEKFWSHFSDVWDCYKSIDGITLEGGTLFRFPLRTSEMAEISNVSKNVFDSEGVEKLMNLFQQSAPSMLLFLNNVNCIKLTTISKYSKVTSSYEVKAKLSSEGEEERERMSNVLAESKGKPTVDIEYAASFYELDIRVHGAEKFAKSHLKRDTRMEGLWLVHHSIGVRHREDSTSMEEGRDLSLLPRVGIAAPIEQTLDRSQSNLFCFLPLPVHWKLPVQINGHFALDSRRRGLWFDSKLSPHSVKQKWNEDLIKFVLVPTYARFLIQARKYVTLNQLVSTGTHSDLRNSLNWFHHLLPRHINKQPESEYLELFLKQLYVYIVEHNCPLLPYTGQPSLSVRDYISRISEVEKTRLKEIFPVESGSVEVTSIKWLEIGQKTDVGILTGYFAQSSAVYQDAYALEVVLLRLGFPVVLSPLTLYNDVLKAKEEANVAYVNPQAVYLFLKNYRTPGSCCQLQLGSIMGTNLTVAAANLVLQYVLKPTRDAKAKTTRDPASDTKIDTNFLSGLPLLITADGELREFSTSPGAYVSTYSDLLPKKPHLFVHRELVETLRGLEDSSLRELNPNDLDHHLPEQGVFPSDWLRSDQYKNWCPSVDNGTRGPNDVCSDYAAGPSKEWIRRLWSYLRKFELKEALKTLENLPIISVSGSRMLVPPYLSHTILLPTSSNLFSGLRRILGELGAVEVDEVVTSVFTYTELASTRVFASIDNPVSIVRVLQYLYKCRQARLPSISNVQIILNYFQSNLEDQSDVSGLKELPLFETVDDNLTEISSARWAYSVPGELPSCGSKTWMTEANCIFLKQHHGFDGIYKKLGLNSKTSDEVYLEYILPCFPRMSQDDRIEHLVFIMTQLERCERLIEKLKVTACFDKCGNPTKTSELYDPTVSMFSKLLLPEEFPPFPSKSVLSEDLQYKWLPFLIRLGLETVCSKSKFLELARKLELEASKWTSSVHKSADYEDWKERSKVMEDHFIKFMENSWSDKDFMTRVSKISFLPSKKVIKKLRELAIPFYERNKASRYATSYSEAVLYSQDNERLCWTSQALLDVIYRKQFRSAIGIASLPKLSDVLTHFSLLVEQAKTVIFPSCEVADDIVKLLSTVLSSIFRHLSQFVSGSPLQELSPFADLRNMKSLSNDLSAGGCQVVEFLSSSSCIFISDKQMFVKPQEVVFSLDPKLYPYLFQLPRDFASHHLLLKRIGVDEKPRPFHCARILEAIKMRYAENRVDSPGDRAVLISAVRLLFETLKVTTEPSVQKYPVKNTCFSADAIEALTPLYLPSRDDKLYAASDLIYLDRVHLENHLVHFRQYNFLINLMKCGLSSLEEETIDFLPPSLRPQKFSQLMEEVLDPDCRQVVGSDEEQQSERLAAMYQHRFSSRFFAEGIRSIYIYDMRSRVPPEIEAGLSLLQSCLRVRCVPEIRTCLKLHDGGEMVRLEGVRKCCFLEKSESEVTLYVATNSAIGGKASEGEVHTRLHGLITWELQSFLRIRLSEFALIMIVGCKNPALIPDTLERLGIPFVNDGELLEDQTIDYYPGKPLLPSHLALLHTSSLGHRFNIDEWVAYEEEENRFVYAIIVYRKYQREEEESELMTHYGIEVGEEELKLVSVLSLYAFMDADKHQFQPERSLVFADSSAPVDDGFATETPGTLEEKKDAVRKQLSEMWELLPEDRKKAIKRLYLQWHPDKTDDLDADEVFKFILNVIDRLDRGDPGYTESNSYSNYYFNWDSYARSYGKNYRQSSSSYTYRPPPYCRPSVVPDKKLGFLFVQQAEADLSVAEALFYTENSDHKRFATVCFLCHEVVEKALKGLLYIKRGISSEYQRKHSFHYFLGAADLPRCPPTLKMYVSRVSDCYYLDSRYPDQHHVLPASQFSRETAERSLQGAKGVATDTRTFAEVDN